MTLLTEPSRVVTVEHERIWVEARKRSFCGGCAHGTGCGHSILDRLGGRAVHLPIARSPSLGAVAPRDTAMLGVRAQVVLGAAARLYLLPLLGVLAGVALGQAWAGDAGAALGAALGLLAAFCGLRVADRRGGRYHRPVVLRVVRDVPAGPEQRATSS